MGVWFSGGIMQPYLETLAHTPDLPAAPVTLTIKPPQSTEFNAPPRRCPQCGCEMQKINYSYDSNIIMDRCNKCLGIWTDKHEAYQAAIYNKGNPKLDRLAASTAEYVQKKERTKEFMKKVEALNQIYDPLYYRDRYGNRKVFIYGFTGVLPLGNDIPKINFPLVVALLLTLNAASLIASVMTEDIASVCNSMGVIPVHIFEGRNLYTLISHMFCHASLIHLFGNMLILAIFGPHVEDAYTHVRFLLFYLFCGLAAIMGYVAVNPHSSLPCVGASGAIAGVMAAYLVLYPSSRIKLIFWGIVMQLPAWTYLIGWFTVQLLAWALGSGNDGDIAWFAHIGGFICGVMITFPFRNTLRVVSV